MFSKGKAVPSNPEPFVSSDKDETRGYPLPWPTSERWNAHYNVPRNSLADENLDHNNNKLRSLSYVRSTRDLDTKGKAFVSEDFGDEDGDHDKEFSSLTHWLEALAELYMNQLDNRARWDPRWLNVTCRERFEGLASAKLVILDYLNDDTGVRRSEPITDKKTLAVALQERPDNSEVRVIMVTDLSRFVIGALGQVYSVDPEFWFDHLVESGYRASDSGLKLKNAVWMNWAEREARFRHRALPTIGRQTEWNVPRRTQERSWVHLRWARLGLLNYLGRKGFHEDEMETRIADGRWTVERDVQLDKYGLLMTKSRAAREAKRAKKAKQRKLPRDTGISTRYKTTNIYRAYSTFESLPRNPAWWKNRDLRVMAPEGASCWSGTDESGKKIIIMLFDPARTMMRQTTRETTPSLTFMPRAAEIESYTEEELWRTPDAGETYLDPHPPPISKKDLKKQKREAQKQKAKEKKKKLRKKLFGATNKGAEEDGEQPADYGSETSYSSDTDYDEEYETQLRSGYNNPHPFTRHRDFARKYALSTHDLVLRAMSGISTRQMLANDGPGVLGEILTRLALDDFWQLVAEMGLELDHIDGDLAGSDLDLHLIESIGITTRQNLCWLRSALNDVDTWANHLVSVLSHLSSSTENMTELKSLLNHLSALRVRTTETLDLLIASTTIAQSSLVINQTSGINKLTELAFFFVPLSLVTSIFSMQVIEFTEAPPAIWTWGISILSICIITYLIRVMLRSPSMRLASMQMRVTIMNRFTSSRPRSAARRLNSVGNRAIAKFLFFLVSVIVVVFGLLTLAVLSFLLIMGGLWLTAAGISLYFIITKWPDPSALVGGFIGLVVAALGMAASWYWGDEISDWMTRKLDASWESIRGFFPEAWSMDRVEDEDLAGEGVKTYARQAILMTST